MSLDDYRPGGFKILPDIVKNLLILNGIFFAAKIFLEMFFRYSLDDYLGLHFPLAQEFKAYQLVSYLFMHGDFSHLFFNMFAIWMFGSAIENVWGPKRFLVYYLITGFGAALIHYIIVYYQISPDLSLMEAFLANPTYENLQLFVEQHQFRVGQYTDIDIKQNFEMFETNYNLLANDPTNKTALDESSYFISQYLEYFKNSYIIVGASGSLFGLLLAFGMMFPNTSLYLMFIPIPIKAKYFVLGYGLIEFVSGLQNNQNDNVAHFAHLGGMLFGFILIRYWQNNSRNRYE